MSILTAIKKRMTPTSLKMAGVVALVAITAGLGAATSKVASAQVIRDCSANSIIKCGALSPAEFIKDVKANKPNDLQTVYSDFGLAPSDYDKFVTHAEMGSDLRDGRIVVNGQTVATDSESIGRQQIPGEHPISIGGHTYYEGTNQASYGKGVNSIPVMVLFNAKGEMQFAVMTACGNPAGGHKITPTYSCNALNATNTSGDTWSFTTDASASNNASIDKVVYDFGDGSATVTEANPHTPVTHAFTRSATVTVKVYVDLPGNQTVVVQDFKCSKHIPVTPPPPPPQIACVQLTLTPGATDQQGDVTYTLTARGSVQNATITGYEFLLGQDHLKQTVNTSNTEASITHTYAPGTYTPSVSVLATANGKSYKVTSPKCVSEITVSKPPVSQIACTQLTLTPGTADSQGNTPYTLTATATAVNGAKITGYEFNFGDNNSQLLPTSNTTATTQHTYAPGTWTAQVTVEGQLVDGKTVDRTSANCTVQITVPTPPQTPPQTCTSPSGQTFPAGSSECQPTPPSSLPNTGPGGVVGLFSGVTMTGAGLHRILTNRRGRRHL